MSAVIAPTETDTLIECIRQNVPEILRNLLVWLLHDSAKTPIYASGINRNGALDAAQDRAQLVDFETAAAALKRTRQACGLGIALGEVPSEEIHISGIDLDHCVRDRQPDERATEILAGANSFAEFSISGTGIHIIGTGDIGTTKINDGSGAPGLEIYSGGRYFTVTGQRINRAGVADITDGAVLARKLFTAPRTDGCAPVEAQITDDTLLNALKGAGLYIRPGKGKHLVRCPWEARHSPDAAGNRNSSSSEAAYFQPGAMIAGKTFANGYFKCQHAHCDDRGLKDLREFLGLNSAKPATAVDRPFVLVPVDDLLAVQAPPQYVIAGLLEANTDVGFVAPPESAKSLLAANMAACVATGKPFHGRTCKRGLVVYLWGEGQAGAARRLQAIEHKFNLGLMGAPLVLSKVATSLLDPNEVDRIRVAISAAQDQYQMPMVLLIVDTVARFLAPGDESKAQDMSAFLSAVHNLRGSATAIACHHPGHGDATRGRGSSSWKAALDTEFSLAKEGDVVTVTCQKMKDGEKPMPFSFRIEQTDTRMAREDRSPIQSVVLVPTDAMARKPVVTGKNQKLLLTELERLVALPGELGIWTEGDLRQIGRNLGMHKNSARDAALGLRTMGYLANTVGGSRLAHDITAGPKDRNRTESTVSVQVQGPKIGPKAPVSLETVPSCLSAGPQLENTL